MKLLSVNLQYFAGEKTEKATPKKRQDTRKKGQVAKSQDVNTAFVLLVGFAVLSFLGGYMKDIVVSIFRFSFEENMLVSLTEKSVSVIFLQMIEQSAYLLAPIMIAAMLAGVISNYMQVGFLFSTETIQFKLNKLNPISGFKRIFSWRRLWNSLSPS